MLQLLVKLLKALNAEDNPAQVAWAVCFAAIMGLTPLMSLHNILVLFLVLCLRVNISAFLVFSMIFTGFAYLLDPLFHDLGYLVLNTNTLQGIWEALYNTSLGRLSGFNNTIVMGSLFFSLIIGAPLYFVALYGVDKYRTQLLPWINRTRLMGILRASNFYRIYTEFG